MAIAYFAIGVIITIFSFIGFLAFIGYRENKKVKEKRHLRVVK